jgi:carbohydrate diacid regulator
MLIKGVKKMLSNKIIQKTIQGLKNITRREIGIIDREGRVISSTEENMIGTIIQEVDYFILSKAESQLIDGYHYFKVIDNGIADYIVTVKGDDETAYQVGQITTLQLQNLITAYRERYSKSNFIKNLLLDNLLLVDVYSRARKLEVEKNGRRAVYLIQTDSSAIFETIEIIRSVYPEHEKDFVTAMDEESIILVKELTADETEEDIMSIAKIIYDNIATEAMNNVYVAVGTVVNDIKNISASYKEAKMALEVGRIFDPSKNIINYRELGIGRLIYQLPTTLCNMFIGEVLKGVKITQLDTEMLTTIDKFFENNLNVSETSRQLYIHRNTLVYRLDKLEKLTGLDLRNFDDAIVFKITLMVSKYMSYKNSFAFNDK